MNLIRAKIFLKALAGEVHFGGGLLAYEAVVPGLIGVAGYLHLVGGVAKNKAEFVGVIA